MVGLGNWRADFLILAAMLVFLDGCSIAKGISPPSGASFSAGQQSGTRRSLGSGKQPAETLVIEHKGDRSRLILINNVNHQSLALQPFGAELRWPALAPDGVSVLYSDGADLYIRATDRDNPRILVRNISLYDSAPYSISPDAQSLGVISTETLLLIDARKLNPPVSSMRAALPKGCEFTSMLWATDSSSVLVLCHLPPANQNYELVRVDRATGEAQTRPIPGITRLLGWNDSGQLVVARNHDGFEQAGVLLASGAFVSLRPVDPGTDRTFVEAYVPGEGDLVLSPGGEDSGDPVVILLAPAGPGPSRRWLARYPRLSELRFSGDGRWATFVNLFSGNTPEQGGDVYLVETGHEDAQILVRGVPGRLSYSSPVLGP
jgi:hypothetical protein